MPEDTQVDAAETPEAEAPQAEKPKAQRNNFAELQRTKDREVAEANRATKSARAELAAANAKLADLTSLQEGMREKSNFTDDDEAWAKRRSELDRDIASRHETLAKSERGMAQNILSRDYGIPTEDLEAYETLADMKVAALEYALRSKNATDEPEPTDEEIEEPEEAPVRSTFDTGTGPGLSKSIRDMSDAEFEAHIKGQHRNAMKNMRPR